MIKNRIQMNSESLQKAFPEVYQNFFSKCSIICSTPRSFTWFGKQAVIHEGLTLRQNIPLRTYIGLIPRQRKTIKISKYIFFNPKTQRFQRDNFDPYIQEKTEKHLLEFLNKICNIKSPSGFDIHILTELPLERSLGSSGAFVSSLLTAALLQNNKIKHQDLASWKNKDFLELKQTKFNYLFKSLWKWENFLFPGASGSSLTSLMPTSTPILYFSKETLPSQSLAGKKIKIDELNFIDQSSYWIIKLNEIIKNPSGWPLPLDFGLIYTGEIRDIHDTFALIKNTESQLIDDAKNCKNDLSKYMKKDQTPMTYTLCQNPSQLWNKYTNTLSINALQSYNAFKKIFKNGFSVNLLKELTELLNREQYLFHLVNLPSPTLDNIITSLKLFIKEYGQEDTRVAAKMASSSRQGDILFVNNSYQVRTKINQIIEKLKEKFKTEITLDYASWIDNSNEKNKGLRIEQFLQKNIYSKYIAKNTIVQKIYSSDSTETKLLEKEEIKKEKIDLLLDTINNKIFIKGKPLTSKQLPSQKTAIEIIKLLLNNQGSIFNDRLPRSSYSTNRNDMQGKIIGPLKKLVKKHTKQDFDLKANGTLSKFYLKINPQDLRISIIDKIS